MTSLGRARLRRSVAGAAALAAFGAACWFGLGMHRGLLLSTDIKSRCWPWAPEFAQAPLQAPLLSDPVWQFVPWIELTRRELAAGRLPLWNPYQDGGVPLLGNAQSAVLSPLMVPVLLLGVGRGWNLMLLLKILAAASGTFLWLRDVGRSRAAAALGAVMFALSGSFVAWLEHPLTLVTAPLPFVLLFGRRLLRQGRPLDCVGTVAASAATLLGGQPEAAAIGIGVAALLLLAEARAVRDVARVATAGVVGALVAAAAVVPFLEYFAHSAARLGAGRFPFALPAAALVRFVLPHAAVGHPIEAAATVSTVGLLLAAAGALPRARARLEVAAACVAVGLLALAYSNPLSHAAARATPVYWSRTLLVLPIPLAVLASGEVDRLRAGLTRAVAKRLGAAAAAVVAGIACGELLAASRGVHAVTPRAYLDRSTPLLEFLARDPGPFRVLPLDSFLPPNSATSVALEDVRGYDALAPREWRVERAAFGRFSRTSYVSDVLEPWDMAPGGAALDRWNVKYLLLHPQLPYTAARMNAELGLDLEEAYLGPDGRVLRNRRALPRARLANGGRVRIVERAPTRWEFAVETAGAGTLIVANPMFPGWEARVDGRRAAIASPVGRAVEVAVPPGSHTVLLLYRPLSVRLGLVLSAAGVAGTVGMAAASRRRRGTASRGLRRAQELAGGPG